MSLDYWDEQGWIEKLEVSDTDIGRLLEIASRNIEEAEHQSHNTDWKFNIFYAAIINIADCALKLSGYRAKAVASHYYLIQSLEYTMSLDSDSVNLIEVFRKKRNIVTYEQGGIVSDANVEEIRKLAHDLLDKLTDSINRRSC